MSLVREPVAKRGAAAPGNVSNRPESFVSPAPSSSPLTATVAAPVIVFAFDRNGTLTMSEGMRLDAFNLRPGEAVGRSVFEFFPEHAEINANLRRALRGESFVATVEVNDLVWMVQYAALRDAHGRVVGSQGVAIDVTESRRAERKTAALLDLAKSIAGTLDPTEILDRAQRHTATILPCNAVATFCRDLEQEVIRMVSQYGLPAALAEQAAALSFRPGEPFGGRIAQGETIVINDVRQQPWLPPELCQLFEIGALLVIPLQAHGRDLGALVAMRAAGQPPFRADEVALCEGIGGHLAVAIERAELYRREQEQAQIGAAAARVGQELISSLDAPVLLERLCRISTDVLGCDCSLTLFLKPDDDVFVMGTAYGFTPEEWESIRTITIPRTLLPGGAEQLWHGPISGRSGWLDSAAQQYDITAGLGVPLRRGSTLIGILTAAYRRRPAHFSAQQVAIAQAIGQLGSMALANARLVEELQRASRLKSEFVATMSHELRTPLNTIIGYTDLLLEGSFGPLAPEQAQVSRRVERSAHELLELINATLDVGRLEAGRVTLELRPTDIRHVVREVDTDIAELRDRPDLTFEWHVAHDVPILITDPLKLKVILKNLITNAIKFTPSGSILVDIRGDDGMLVVSVTDTGIGIAPEAVPFIFDAFRQGDSSMSRRYGGVGLGLYIVRRLLDALGGKVTVTSEVGSGSTFHVTLPREAPGAWEA